MSFQYLQKGRATGPSDIFIATTSGSSPKPNYVDSMVDTVRKLARAGIEADWLLHHGDPHVDDGRNACVAEFLKSGAPKMLFIDDDVGWVAEELIRFIGHDRDVVAGIYPKKSDTPDWPVRLIAGPLQADEDGLLQVEAVPTGFLMISRRCLLAMAEDATHFNRKDSGSTPLLFERGVDHATRWSGDYWWSRKWTAAGGTIWIDPEMNFTHMGLKTWTGCIGDHWRKANGIIDPHLDGAFRLLQRGVATADIWAVLSGRSENYPWCAPEEMMGRCYEMAKATTGPVLEVGSGLTSIIMGMAGAEVHTLEHDYGWYKTTRERIARYGLTNVHLHYAPIREYADGTAWHEVPEALPGRFDLVVCDGPPRTVCDRRALWSILGDRVSGADWIVDDVNGDAGPIISGTGRQAELVGRFAVILRPETTMSEVA